MKFALRRLVHHKYTFHALYAVVLGVFVITLLYGLSAYISNNREAALLEEVSDINNEVAAIPSLQLARGTQLVNTDAFLTGTQNASSSLSETDFGNIPLFVRVLPGSGPNDVQARIDFAVDELQTSETELAQLAQTTEVLKKFLDYSPAEDFASFGEDATLDAERFDRTRQGFTAISQESVLTDELRTLMDDAISALDTFQTDESLATFVVNISTVQDEITTLLNQQAENIRLNVNSIYNELLYQ